ncbi:hypothetical protein B9Z55_006858 [Caenorhabditis nigoni]|uniref:MATH domain-containing protein n=1 Tax=Caenorhabditis nigoni TaxID=1611254 RepID=A0A2G5V721_9PELO|nr:hypothetical protein B9Z55_006858 [Caenorhabditis nigoni]
MNTKSEKIPNLGSSNDTLDELKKFVSIEIESFQKSNNYTLDKIAEKLQTIEESVSKISILNNNKANNDTKSKMGFVLKHNFKDVKEAGKEFQSSKGEEHFQMTWDLQAAFSDRQLRIYLNCEPHTIVVNDWKMDVKIEVKLVGDTAYTTIKTTDYIFDSENKCMSMEFPDYDDYVFNNDLLVEVKVEIQKMTGKKAKIGLLVSQTVRALLSDRCEEFRVEEIELKDIDQKHFQKFLEIFKSGNILDDDSVEGILQLSNIYMSPTAVADCEQFLMQKSKKRAVDKLKLALRFNLVNLKSKCIDEIAHPDDIKKIIDSKMEEMDLSTSQALLSKSLNFFFHSV